MRRAPRIVSIVLAGLPLAAAILLYGCARRDEAPRGPAVERSGSSGTLHYRLRSQVSPARVTLGDRAVWRLTAELSDPARPGTLLRGEADSSLEIKALEGPSASRGEGAARWSASLEVRGYDLGRVPLPRAWLTAATGSAADTLEFPPDTLYVDSLTAAMTGSVEPDRGPLPTELRPVDYAVAIVGALLLIAAIVVAARLLLSRRRRSPAAAALVEAPESPEAALLRSIEGLRAEIGTLPRDRFYDRLSLAIRAYAAAVTLVPALDRTTGELERELLARGDDANAVRTIGAMLRRSDLAKFARHEDPLAEAREALEGAAALAGRLRPAPEPVPAATSSGAAG